SYENLTSDKIIFHEAKEYKVKNSKLKYQRIKIETKFPNGKKGALVIETPFLFSFGVTERLNQETNQPRGYSIPVCLWGKEEKPNESEKSFFEAINKVTEIYQHYLEEEFGPDMASYLTNSLYWKQVEYTDKKAAPVLYAKRIYSDKSKKILSLFRTKGNDKVSPFDYLNQYCKVKMALIIESIYLSKNIVSLQIKVHEAYIKPLKPMEALLSIKESDEDENE
ncbi:unnamed protein product, partial [Porites lobata]